MMSHTARQMIYISITTRTRLTCPLTVDVVDQPQRCCNTQICISLTEGRTSDVGFKFFWTLRRLWQATRKLVFGEIDRSAATGGLLLSPSSALPLRDWDCYCTKWPGLTYKTLPSCFPLGWRFRYSVLASHLFSFQWDWYSPSQAETCHTFTGLHPEDDMRRLRTYGSPSAGPCPVFLCINPRSVHPSVKRHIQCVQSQACAN